MERVNKKRSGIFMAAVLSVIVLLSGTLVGFTAAKDSNTLSVENINLIVTGCNVMVKTLSSNVIGTSSAQDGFRYEIDEAIHRLTALRNGSTMNIELSSTGKSSESFTDMAIIFIPKQQYSKITVIGSDAGVSLPPLNANINMTSSNGAMSVRVPNEFNKTNKFINKSGSGVVVDIDDDKMSTLTIKNEVYYIVDSEKQLRLIGTEEYPLSANYMLNRDIELKETWIPIGNNDAVPFTGRFNGNGFTIKNVSIDDHEGNYKYIGFFGLVQGGTIHNITLENVSIKTNRNSDVVIAPKNMIVAVVQGGKVTDCVVK